MNRINVTLVFLMVISIRVCGQSPCENALFDANKLYQKGQFNACISVIENCQSNFTSKSEKFESSHLLALSYMALNQSDKVDQNIIRLLRYNPEYQKFPNVDPLDFSRLLNTYRVEPRWFLGLKVGANRNGVALKRSYATYITTQRYLPTTGYQFGLNAEFSLSNRFSLHTDWMNTGLDVLHEIDDAGGWKQRYKENQQYTGWQIGMNYHVLKKKQPDLNVGAGINLNYLYGSNVFFESERITTGTRLQGTQNPLNSRYQWQPGIFVEGGLGFWVLKGMLTLSVQYQHYLRNTVNPDERLKDLEFVYNNHYVSDDVSIRQLNGLIGYKIPLSWKVIKKKE